jgi:NDP-sugar pyrophosphorylase family protein
MNEIQKSPIGSLGYNFIPSKYIPKGKDEYYLRNIQNRNGIRYRKLTAYEIEVLVRNRNTSDDWNKVLVSDAFNPELVKNCKFFGLVRIGKLEPLYLSFHDIRLTVGFYNSTIISSDFGDNVVVDNVNYISHYIVGNEVIIVNVNELSTTDHSKFGNGILKDGENESVRIWLELCNENGGRSVIPFNGMLPGDAYLWSKYRDDEVLMKKFKEFTQKEFDNKRGYYGKIGDRTVIKNSKILKDVWIGSDAYIKGANKLKNLTINSSPEEKSQIGEGVELVNGIVGYGCRIFYGVKAVRFILASHSQLKYGARLINSYLGNNSTISCCEVLNSLIFPAHEQHHNNSFLCAALVMGQSNMAAGATIGSNHNSRSADGELIAARGFWPGLCVSLKHNSKFASFTLVAKSDYPCELNIPIPFSLVSNDVSNNKLVIMPAFWFMYNMYALARNAVKYVDRDKRTQKLQLIEYDYLAPDSINEVFESLELMKKYTGTAFAKKNNKKLSDKEIYITGEKLLEEKNAVVNELEILAEGFENSRRKTRLVKVLPAYFIFKELITYYGVSQLVQLANEEKINSWKDFSAILPLRAKRGPWVNAGSQLLPQASVNTLLKQIHSGKIKDWNEVHAFYQKNGEIYKDQKLQHAFASLLEINKITPSKFNKRQFRTLLEQAVATREWMVKAIYDSRAKDHHNEFRKMVYETQEQMDKVLGRLDENTFIKQQEGQFEQFKNEVNDLMARFKL